MRVRPMAYRSPNNYPFKVTKTVEPYRKELAKANEVV